MGLPIIIRADGNKAIGMGHLNRASILSKMLKTRFAIESMLVMREDKAGFEFAHSKGLNIKTIPSEATTTEEKRILKAITYEYQPTIWILDVLQHDTDASYTGIFRQNRCSLVAITDDSAYRYIDADIIINGNPNQEASWYSHLKQRYYVGPHYFVMDSQYAGYEVPAPKGIVKRLLITLGGSDHNDIIFILLNAVAGLQTPLVVTVISSQATGYLDRLSSHCASMPYKVNLLTDVPSLQPFWQETDCAITAGGNTLFERIAVRLPGATVCQLKRQMEIADAFAKRNVNVNFGFGPELTVAKLEQSIYAFLANQVTHRIQHEKAPEVLDGKGLRRVGDEIESLLNGAANAL